MSLRPLFSSWLITIASSRFVPHYYSHSIMASTGSSSSGGGGRRFSRALDVYRKIDPDLTRATPMGAFLSISGMLIMFCLFVLEVKDFITPEITSRVVMDPGGGGAGMLGNMDGGNVDDDLRINFNITLERVACPHISVELHNQMGTHRLNISTNINRFRVKTKGDVRHVIGEMKTPNGEPRRILIGDVTETEVERDKNVEPTTLTPKNFESFIASKDVVLVNFFAPWCVWCKRLHPLWVAVAHDLALLSEFKRVGIAWVDCTASDQVDLCHSNHVNAFPTILAFKSGDSHSAEQYHGDRTMEAFQGFAREQLAKVQRPETELADTDRELQALELADKMDGDGKYSPAVEGCRLEGFIRSPKVPGTLVFATNVQGLSFDPARLNVSHEIHHLSFGPLFTKEELARLPSEVSSAIHKLDGRKFESSRSNLTHEHFVKIVGSTFNFYHHGQLSYYKYLHYASPFHASSTLLPTVKMHFDIAPIHVVIDEKSKPLYKFITNLFAIIGGTFTVFGLLDSLFDSAHQVLRRKIELGKAS